MTILKPGSEHESLRLDVYISGECEELSRSAAVKLIESGLVTCEGVTLKKNHRVTAGEIYRVIIPERKEGKILPQDIPLDIVYEDENILIINKPRGMVVHPAAGNLDGTLVNALLHHCGDNLSSINGEIRRGIVHRIDKDTSGLLAVAKNDFAHCELALQLADHHMRRIYHALVCGYMRAPEGTIDAPIGRNAADRKKMAVTDKNSRRAVTHYRALSEYLGYSLLECSLETGRTHQIRVHLSYMGRPVAGDTLYGGRDEFSLDGQCLHAKLLSFRYPGREYMVTFETEYPEYFTRVINILEKRMNG
ncbi:MAG: RluA family pseudouridine synthase [Clostridiales bacterium]|nr:RluA family pseudouridine synthase [Clostridiales bacterium]